VAIGASAGGIRAIESVLSTVPADTGAAFVILLHQSPLHSSALPALLARKTAMKVVAAEDVTKLVPNVVYVLPPGMVLLHVGEVLRVTDASPSAPHNTIDTTLSSVAEVYGDGTIGVVLSGVGTDGSLGLAAVRAHGGVTLAQDDAEQPGMPRSAVAGGFVDHFLPIEELAQQLVRQIAYARKVTGRPERDVLERQARERLNKVLTLVRASTGHDFQNYKQNTILRRIQRRMQVRQVTEVDDYVALLRSDPDEPRRLLQDLLIGVTQFFRDAPAFEALETRVLRDLLRDRPSGNALRVWVPACATGEEAYSLAIAFYDAIERENVDVELHMFATDIDEAALAVARRGIYPSSVQNDVSPERLKRFFHREGDRYRVAKRIRDAIVFSVHNVIKDPRFRSST
jgi:two-component system CheB/CheR fusion protein